MSKNQPNAYRYVRGWFVQQFPEYKELPDFTSGKLNVTTILSVFGSTSFAPFAGESEVRTRFNVPREQLSESVVHTILRIVRELVVNATRHGKATRIRIAGDYRDGVIRFSVRDNGCGFDPDGVPGPINGHFGLQGIRERLAESNGSIRIESEPGSGTSIAITIAARNYDE